MKVNKVFWGWKLEIRKRKVSKLKISIIEHSLYKRVLKTCFKEWALYVRKMKAGEQKLRRAWRSYNKRVVLHVLKYKVQDDKAKDSQRLLKKGFSTTKA